MILTIDTATPSLGLAVLRDGLIVTEQRLPATRRITEQLAPAIESLFHELDFAPAAVRAVAVTSGPGSFSGLRTGLAWAKGFVFAQAIPLIAVPTLDVLAYTQPFFDGPLIATLAAGRNRIAAQPYTWRDNRWLPDELPPEQRQTTTWASLAATINRPTAICGAIDASARATLAPLGDQVTLAPPHLNVRRAAALAVIAQNRLAAGESDDPLTLAPDYWHQPT